jgi:hypothetical protein
VRLDLRQRDRTWVVFDDDDPERGYLSEESEAPTGKLDVDCLWLQTVLTGYRKRAIPRGQRAAFDERCDTILAKVSSSVPLLRRND